MKLLLNSFKDVLNHYFVILTLLEKRGIIMKKNKVLLIILLLLLIVIGFMMFFIQNKNGTQLHIPNQKLTSKTTSEYLFKTISGKEIELKVADNLFKIKGMENKIVFLKVFGWECKFCQKEIPQLIKLKNQLSDSFEVIAIEAQQHTVEESKIAIKKYGINYNIVSGNNQQDFYRYLQKKYGWTGIIPLTIVISKKGKVLAFELGEKSYSLAELMKASLLRE